LAALLPVLLVVVTIATMVVIKASGGSPASSPLTRGGSAAGSFPGTTALSPSVVQSLSSVTAATFDAVGSPGSVVAPIGLGGQNPILRAADGRPVITYVGAEYCPYCAAERWALAVALSRFGTFTNISGTESSGSDAFPNTQTLSFYGSSYSSPYLHFDAVEEASNRQITGTYQTLQQPSAAQSALLVRYDTAGSIPFLDIANRYVINGASYSPQVLQGLTRSQIADQLNDPKSPVAQAIDGTANQITAALCTVTGNQPSSVASSPTILSIEKNLRAA
jgi:thiol-disulfide isomerase/thioredoxin